jgi:maltose O-acetyltransferase
MGKNGTSWFKRASIFGSRLARASLEEVVPVHPRKIVAESLASLFPSQTFNRTRTALLRAAGVRVGDRSLLQGPIRLTGNGNPCELLSIGEDTLITGVLHADLGAPIRIGRSVRIGHDVSLLTVNHAIGERWLRSGTSIFGAIEIGDGAWIASRVTVLPGVKIGAGSVVAAGAVVTRDVEPNTLVAGVPARVVRRLDEE